MVGNRRLWPLGGRAERAAHKRSKTLQRQDWSSIDGPVWRGFEALEPRLLLDAAPTFGSDLTDQFLQTTPTTLTIAIDGEDADGDPLLITAVSDDPHLSPFVPQGNRFARMNFVESDEVTPVGSIEIELFDGRFPANSERIVALSTTGFDDEGNVDPDAPPFWTNVLVHRVIPEFIIQTGDAELGSGSGSSPLGVFDAQVDPSIASFSGSGVLAFANRGSDASTSDSQIFITAGPTPFLNPNFAIAGHLITGQAVFDDIINRPRDQFDRPEDPPVLASVDIFESTQDGSLTMSIDEDFDGRAAVTVSLDDGTGNITSQTFNVVHVGQRPSIEAPDELVIAPGETGPLELIVLDDLDAPVDIEFITDQEGVQTAVQVNEQRGKSLALSGNTWKAIRFPYELTEDTILEFDFSSSREGEIHGIGFDENTSVFSEDFFQLFGTQTAGIQAFNDYSRSSTKHYVIPVGGHLTGEMTYVTFVNDHDVDDSAAQSVFSNVQIYEAGATPADPINFAEFSISVYDSDQDVDGTFEVDTATHQALVNLPDQDLVFDLTISAVEAGFEGVGLEPTTHTILVSTFTERPTVELPEQVLTSPGEVVTFTAAIEPESGIFDISIETDYVPVMNIFDSPRLDDQLLTGVVPDVGTTYTDESGLIQEIVAHDATLPQFPDEVFVLIQETSDGADPSQTHYNYYHPRIGRAAELIGANSDPLTNDGFVIDELPAIDPPPLAPPPATAPRFSAGSDDLTTVPYLGGFVGRNDFASGQGSVANTTRAVTYITESLIGVDTLQVAQATTTSDGTTDFVVTWYAKDDSGGLWIFRTFETGVNPFEANGLGDVVATIDPQTAEVTVELPPQEHVHFDVTVSVVEPDFDLPPVTASTTVTTLGDRPVIEDTGPILLALDEPTRFTPTITDDNNALLELTVSSSSNSVSAVIDPNTYEVTLTPFDDGYHVFEITITAVEQGTTGLEPVTAVFDVVTGSGLVATDEAAETFTTFVSDGVMFVANGEAGLSTFDVQDLQNPVPLGVFDAVNARDVVVVGTTAFVADNDGALMTLDVSDPASPTRLDRERVEGSPLKVLFSDDVAYVSGRRLGVIAFDVSRPSNIVLLGSLRQLRGQKNEFEMSFWMEKKDNYLYVSDSVIRRGSVEIIDVSDPSNMRHVRTLLKNAHPSGMALVDDRLYVVDRSNGGLHVYDAKRSSRPVLRGSISGLGEDPRRVNVVGSTAIVSSTTGFQLVDVSDPRNMFVDRLINGPSRGAHPTVFGEQVALPFLDAGAILIADGNVLDNRVVIEGRSTIVDRSGIPITVSVGGPGLVIAHTTGIRTGDIRRLKIVGTSLSSSVRFRARGDGASVGEIFVSGLLGGIIAPNVDLVGDLFANRFIRRLVFDDVIGSNIDLGLSFHPRHKLSAMFDDIDNMTFASQMPVSQFRATRWLDSDAAIDDQMVVPSITNLQVKENFQAHLTLTGGFTRGALLRTAKVGALEDADWIVAGPTGVISVPGAVRNWRFQSRQDVTRLALGDVVDSTIITEQVLGVLAAKRWRGGQIIGNQINMLRIGGDRQIPGDLRADIQAQQLRHAVIDGNLDNSTITLMQDVVANRPSVRASNNITVAGFMTDSVLRSRGHLGQVRLGGMRRSNVFAGVRDDLDTLPASRDDFITLATIRGLSLKGVDGEPFAMLDSNAAAWRLTRVELVDVLVDNAGRPFGLAANTIDKLDLDTEDPLFGAGGPNNDSVIRIV